MGTRTLTGLACVVLLAPGCGGSEKKQPPAPAPRTSATVSQTLDKILAKELETSAVPGISAAIVFPDGHEWTGAVGVAVVEPRQPMTPQTAMVFDSVTKVATASLALKLAEEGKLRLDDPIVDSYRAWKGDPKATLRDLLGHTSGAREPPGSFVDAILEHPKRAVTPRQAAAASAEPGPRTDDAQYSNAGFLIAGLILEKAAGEPLGKAMRELIFDHPGGDGLVLQPTEATHPPRAHQYWHPRGGADADDASDGGAIMPFRAWSNFAWSAGSLAGDVPNLARWGHELLGGRVLAPASLKQMTRFHAFHPWTGYGLGLGRDDSSGLEMWGHSGDGLGSHTELWHAPQKNLTVAFSWNDDDFDSDPVFMRALVRAALS
ncbi:beta-lactamase family protein [Solirubrobacter ginsenosidimutans]|uniref:Beta-lactamase family protein n=1 Tax=Solirubrobacter ginsenosidimutans TaxID=490573 RepID=A0A9X3MSW0_9ACTN|nr:serine hydrolase domain-containing protein [Solirubrobacter ginsenosidimutans]MDA0162441.1 beta-lactamase family protein [Solirubrobacter ginsenosidimutans]